MKLLADKSYNDLLELILNTTKYKTLFKRKNKSDI